jgi:tetratricopeptide (TPR) repeat protein
MLRSFLPFSLTLALVGPPLLSCAVVQAQQTPAQGITPILDQASSAKQQGQSDQVIALYKKALIMAVQTNDRPQQALIHLALSQIYWGQQRFNDAIPDGLKAVELSEGNTYGTALMSLGRIYDDATDYPKSLNAYQTALAHSEKTNGDPTLRASVKNNLGAVYLHLGEVQKSETLFAAALATAQSQQQQFANPLTPDSFDRSCRAAKQDQTAMPDRLLGQFCGQRSAAVLLPKINQARSQYLNLNRQLESATRNNLGILRRNSGDYAAALKEQQQALIMDQALNPQGGATSLNNIGNLYNSLGNYPQAIETFERSLALLRANPAQSNLGQTLNNLALVYGNQGNYRKALELNEEALKVLQRVNDRVNQAIAMDNLATHHQALGNYSKAQDYYNQALAIHRATGGKSGEANTLANLAVLADTKGDYKQGQTLHNQAIALFRAIGEKDKVATSMANQAREAEDQGQYPQALDLYNQALEIHRSIGNKNWQASTLGNLGGTYRALGQYGKSLD